MISIRAIASDELPWFASLDPVDSEKALAQVRSFWDAGSSRPDWTLVAEADGRPLARLALYTQPFGCGLGLAEAGVALPWMAPDDPAARVAAIDLLERAAELMRPVAVTLERRLNAEVHPQVETWRGVLADAGFELFQEKDGFVWTDAGEPLPEPNGLTFTSLVEVGEETYADALARAILGTLDRNDRYYLDMCGPGGWAREMVNYLEPGWEDAWLVGYDTDRTLTGYVALVPFEPGVGTIAHVGVVPEHRGKRRIDDLLRAANMAARRHGLESMLSDVDTENWPMIHAMERNDHRRGVRPWHVWSYRRSLR